MDNFDKIFAQKLQQEQEFDFRESDWQEVADRLDTVAPAPTVFNWKAWAVAAILLSLLGGMGWLAVKLNDATNTIKRLQNQPVAKNFHVDTIYKEVAVVRVDTVFKTRTIAAASATSYFSTTPFFTNNQRFNTHDISVTGTGILGTSFFSPFFKSNDRWQTVDGRRIGNVGGLLSERKISAEENEVMALTLPEALTLRDNELLTLPATTLKIKEISTSELTLHSDPRMRDYLRPIGSKFGVSAGKSFLAARDLTNVASSNIGLKGELQFVKNISMTAAVDWFRLSYQATELSNLGQEIPMPTAEEFGVANPTDLTFVSVNQRFTQYKVGLKYAFPTKTTATPYIGINYLASTNFKKDFYYFFEVPTSQGFVDLDKSSRFSNYNSDGFGLDLGVELQSQEWLIFQIEGYYHFITPEMRSQYYDLVGIRLTALVNFKQR